jgi:hypothetical protein
MPQYDSPVWRSDSRAAWEYLKDRGYSNDHFLILPPKGHTPQEYREIEALRCLVWDWDWSYSGPEPDASDSRTIGSLCRAIEKVREFCKTMSEKEQARFMEFCRNEVPDACVCGAHITVMNEFPRPKQPSVLADPIVIEGPEMEDA